MSFLVTVISVFALVGSLAIAYRIFKSKMGVVGKVLSCLILLGIMKEMFKPDAPFVGIYNPLAALLASGGIFIVGDWLFHRKAWEKDWRPKLGVVVGALALLLVMWWPVYDGPAGTLPRTPMPTGWVSPGSPTISPTVPMPSSAPTSLAFTPRRSCSEAPTFQSRNELRRRGMCVDP